MKGKLRLVIVWLSYLSLLFACGGGGGDNSPPPERNPTWTWMSGSNTTDQPGIYGTSGTPDISNVPGARYGSVSWADSGGTLWLFGGRQIDSSALNDLWKYDPATSKWTWISGNTTANQAGIYGTKRTADPSNVPGARSGAISWTDSGDALWLFGGDSYDSAGRMGILNDLWRFEPSTREWTWVSGSDIVNQAGVYGTRGLADSSNVPGARSRSVSWIDSSGNLWLFGGYGYDSAGAVGILNDLWVYNPTSHEWTWISGSDSTWAYGTYGTKGTPALSNVPGARSDAVSWTDSSGTLWIFGGSGLSTDFMAGSLNDLWKYDVTSREWTWVSGSSHNYGEGVYGTKGTAAPSNMPGAREGAAHWTDSGGQLCVFGGIGIDGGGIRGDLNDMWIYHLKSLEWTWVSGSNVTSALGVYGIKGTAGPSNVPGARMNSVQWTDSHGNLWLFGGLGYASAGDRGCLNDLWQCSR